MKSRSSSFGFLPRKNEVAEHCADDVKQAIANKIICLPGPVNAVPMHSANGY
jgi:hypothetical protein